MSKLVDGRFLRLGTMGRGGMGMVYRALDVFLDRLVALKVVPSSMVNDENLEALRHEAATLAKVQHDNVVKVFTFGPDQDAWYFAMEFIAGDTLGEILEEHEARRVFVPLQRVMGLARSIASGLDAVHRAGLVHRDLKPTNVVIEGRTGRAVLIDFGLAITDGAVTNTAFGTARFASPEQGSPDLGVAVTTRSDIYSFAVLLYELIAIRPLFENVSDAADWVRLHINTPPPKLSATRPELAALDLPFQRALSKDPQKRFATASEFVDAISHALESAADVGPVAPRTPDSATSSEIRVLVVDDDTIFNKIACRAAQVAFDQRPESIHSARSGTEALSSISQRMPHLLVLDFNMPHMNGLELLSTLRAMPNGHSVRVLVVSASLRELEVWQFKILGVSDFAEKPVGFSQLATTMRELARGTGLVRPTEIPRP